MGWPDVPDFPGREHAITSNEAFYLPELPKRVVVVGAATSPWNSPRSFQGLGAKTTLLYRRELFLRGFDRLRASTCATRCRSAAMTCNSMPMWRGSTRPRDGSLQVTLKDGRMLDADCVFYATGRRPMLDDLGLENTGVALDDRGFIEVGETFQTAEPSIYAIGDVIGRVQLTPVALAEGMTLARHLFDPGQLSPAELRPDRQRGLQPAQSGEHRPERRRGAWSVAIG